MNHPNGNMRTLVLPSGGTIDIPLPGSKSSIVMRPSSMLHDADGGSNIPLLIAGVVIGVAVGVAATAWYLRR
jgi:hypothetical protein